MIRTESLVQRYGRTPVLHGISLDIAAGETILLLGANGAGKSTLFRCLLGIVAFAGTVLVDGLDPLVAGREVRRRIGYLPQHDGLQGDMTVAESAAFTASLRGLPPAEGARAVVQARLDDVGGRRVDELSGGMRRRLAFALALVGDPPILLLDEPTAGLDGESREALTEHLRKEHRDRTIVLATHLPGEHEEIAHRSLTLEAGELVVPRLAAVAGGAS